MDNFKGFLFFLLIKVTGILMLPIKILLVYLTDIKVLFMKIKTQFDPFAEVAKNGSETTFLFPASRENLSICTQSTLTRIRSEYQNMGKTPIVIYIAAQHEESLSYHDMEGYTYVDIKVKEDFDPLSFLLELKTILNEYESESNLHINIYPAQASIGIGTRVDEYRQNFSNSLEYTLTTMSQIQNSALLVVCPNFHQGFGWLGILIRKITQTSDICVQQLNLGTYTFIQKEEVFDGNVLLFPVHGFRDKRLVKDVGRLFPNISPKYLRMNFLRYSHVVYNLEGKQGIYFMKRHETTDPEDF